jgi:DNA helicase-2/ATP-dependent DNA helicase PcrA
LAKKFEHVLIDEYQDTNHAQFVLIKNLSIMAKSIFAIGDPAQTIFSFAGSDISNILNFEKAFKGTTVYHLSKNFRSVKTVANVANAVISKSKQISHVPIEVVKNEGEKARCYIFDRPDSEAGFICDEIINLVRRKKAKYSDFAILYRTRVQSKFFEEVFVKTNVPYRILGGLGFYRLAAVKDIIAYMRLLVNMKDDASFIRVYNKPTRGIGKATLNMLCDLRDLKDCSLMEVLRYKYFEGPLKPRAVSSVSKLRGIFTRLRKLPKANVEDVVIEIIKQTGYRTKLENSTDKRERKKLEQLDSLIDASNYYDMMEGGGLSGFLEWVSIMQDSSKKDEERNCVSLMTCHSSKGLEFKRVYVVGATDNKMPLVREYDENYKLRSEAAIAKAHEEERRLFFVAVTRAEEVLTITCHLEDYYGLCNESPFLKEAEGMIRFFDYSETEIGTFRGADTRGSSYRISDSDYSSEDVNKKPIHSTATPVQQKPSSTKTNKKGGQTDQFNFWS